MNGAWRLKREIRQMRDIKEIQMLNLRSLDEKQINNNKSGDALWLHGPFPASIPIPIPIYWRIFLMEGL